MEILRPAPVTDAAFQLSLLELRHREHPRVVALFGIPFRFCQGRTGPGDVFGCEERRPYHRVSPTPDERDGWLVVAVQEQLEQGGRSSRVTEFGGHRHEVEERKWSADTSARRTSPLGERLEPRPRRIVITGDHFEFAQKGDG